MPAALTALSVASLLYFVQLVLRVVLLDYEDTHIRTVPRGIGWSREAMGDTFWVLRAWQVLPYV